MRPLQNFWRQTDYLHLIEEDPFYCENSTNHCVTKILTCHSKDRSMVFVILFSRKRPEPFTPCSYNTDVNVSLFYLDRKYPKYS